MDVSTGKSVQLTRGKKSAGSADWSPDGRWLAFVIERESSAVEPVTPVEKTEERKEAQKEGKPDEEPAAQANLAHFHQAHGGQAEEFCREGRKLSIGHRKPIRNRGPADRQVMLSSARAPLTERFGTQTGAKRRACHPGGWLNPVEMKDRPLQVGDAG